MKMMATEIVNNFKRKLDGHREINLQRYGDKAGKWD